MSSELRFLALAMLPVFGALAASAVAPYDRLTWWMEVLPVLLVVPVLAATVRRFPLSRLLVVLIALHALILIAGGTWTYARVPAGFWVQEAFDLARNPYDKLGHFAQGLVPAVAARELLLRHGWVSGRAVAAWLSVCVAMTISAVYELVEWAAALALGQGADEFLGTQGDQWDTQSDMFLALIGALVAVLLLARWHDRALGRLRP
jgi:putative membrane protein